jgi:hypothetical protein
LRKQLDATSAGKAGVKRRQILFEGESSCGRSRSNSKGENAVAKARKARERRIEIQGSSGSSSTNRISSLLQVEGARGLGANRKRR